MKSLLLRWAILAGVLYLVAQSVPGIQVSGAKAAFFAIFALALLNALVQPFLFIFKLFTFPINFLTLGLFALGISWLVNILVFLLVGWSQAIEGFEVEHFSDAFIGSLVLSLTNAVVSHLVRDRDREEEEHRRR